MGWFVCDNKKVKNCYPFECKVLLQHLNDQDM
jgi:hypothetical protein